MKVMAIIPARAGSKGIKGKNIRDLMGHPLIAYSICAAKKTASISRIVVSSDSSEILDIAKKYGAETPFIRPAELAQDDSPDLPLFVHCLEWFQEKEGYCPDIVVHLRPTSPLRSVEYIEQSIEMLVKNPQASAVRSVNYPNENPYKMWVKGNEQFLGPLISCDIKEAYNMPRKLLPEVLWQNGNVDTIRTETIMADRSMTGDKILPLLMEEKYGHDIDTEFSWFTMEQRLKQHQDIYRELFDV